MKRLVQWLKKWLGIGWTSSVRWVVHKAGVIDEDPTWRMFGYLPESEMGFLRSLRKFPTDGELVSAFAGFSGWNVERIFVYKWDGGTTAASFSGGAVSVVPALFDMSLGNTIRAVEFIEILHKGCSSSHVVAIYVEDSKDGKTNITPEFVEFLHESMKSWKWSGCLSEARRATS